ncbi:arabinitol 2-dehydrogenase [Seminavis robusta]|uniref:Arabinitol 2-dehydrogenase n=1 Tax=Seminavis robusta TaxID=568900 RepID=A0A9N8DH95_9STRA|nr:arabinitol 2-dehydrogenase [Seminavis robusta]|eukprot:Sro158_g071450.1 arabinitol 2-dehydrogenase (279) ;mRNA; r:12071-13040
MMLQRIVYLYVSLLLSSYPGQCLMMSASASSTPAKKLVIVTGGSRGIGRATCVWLASKGYQVAVNYNNGEEAAQEVVAEIESAGGSAKAFQCDIGEETQVEEMFEDVMGHFGMPPTGLVANAGIMEAMEKDIRKVSTETLERDLKVNTMGTFFCTRAFVKHCSVNNEKGGQGGSIVVVSSVSAESALILAYGMSKAALEAMVNGLSKQLPLEGIRINTIIPGLIDTGLAAPEIIETMKGFIPLRRAGDPTEVAQAIEFLLSDASSYCSGTKLKVSGGL